MPEGLKVELGTQTTETELTNSFLQLKEEFRKRGLILKVEWADAEQRSNMIAEAQKMIDGKPREEWLSEYSTMYLTQSEEKMIIRAKLIGAEFPKELEGKQSTGQGDSDSEQRFLTEEVEVELAKEGYVKNDSGVWEKK